MTIQFEAGKTYVTCSICDSDALVRVEVVSRTAKTIQAQTMKGLKTLRISTYEGVEQVSPWGRYSMSPVVGADDTIREGVTTMLVAAVAEALGLAA